MRALGIDLGERTIGLALSDALGMTAQPLTTLRRAGGETDLAALRKVCAEHQVSIIVVGLPLNMDGSEGLRARMSREFAERLRAALGIPVELWDERLTTVGAQRALLEADLSRKKRREVIDSVAAALILEGWLGARAAKGAEG